MPTVAVIYGIKKQFYWDDHEPAHFHAEYAEYRCQIIIDTLRGINGYMPNSQYRKVIAWAKLRKRQLLAAWIRCRSDLHPGKIA
jgi:hypothetical protein